MRWEMRQGVDNSQSAFVSSTAVLDIVWNLEQNIDREHAQVN